MICSSLGEFLFKLYVYRLHPRCGHVWYAVHHLDNRKLYDADRIVAKIKNQYGVVRKSNRYYRRKKGFALVEVMMLENMLLMTATNGYHDNFFIDQRQTGLHNFRERPLKVSGYAIGITDNHPSILIEENRWERIHGNFLTLFWHQDDCQQKLNQITPFSFWHIVNCQLQPLAKELTKKRRSAGLPPVKLVLPRAV